MHIISETGMGVFELVLEVQDPEINSLELDLHWAYIGPFTNTD